MSESREYLDQQTDILLTENRMQHERIAALEAQVQTLRELIDRHLKADAKMEGPVYYIQNCQGFGKAYTALAATEEK